MAHDENKLPAAIKLSHVENHGHGQEDVDEGVLSFIQSANDTERSMTLAQGLKLYPKAAAWSIALSSALIMEGYDKLLLGSLYAFPAFQKRFGQPQPPFAADGTSTTYEVTAAWQSGLSNGAHVGEIIGLLFSGWLSEKYGYRRVMGAALISMTATIFLLFFAQDIGMLQAGYVLTGVPWGIFQTITTTYAAEVCPVVLRPYLTTYVNLCWVMGQFLASGVLRGFMGRADLGDWSWRIPYALQWFFPLPILVLVILAPESPWWLVRKGKMAKAEGSLRRLTGRITKPGNSDGSTGTGTVHDDLIRRTITFMSYTNEMEQENTAGTSYRDCFRGVNLRRTEIACAVWSVQNLCGNSFMGYSTYFYQQAGLPPAQSFNMSLGQSGLALVGTLLSWVFMTRFGRRTLYTTGLVLLDLCLLAIGVISVAPGGDTEGGAWAIGSMLLVFVLVYNIFIGAICYSLVAEIPSTRLRPKTVVLARSVYNVFGIINAVLTPYMLNPSAWNWKGKAGFFWFGICTLCIVYCYFRLPEPAGRTYAELDILFEAKVSASKFATTKVDFASSHANGHVDQKGEVTKEAHTKQSVTSL